MYYKDYLPIIRRDDLCTLQESLVVEIKSRGQYSFFTCLYRSPVQNQDQFEVFCGDIDLCLSNFNDLNQNCSVLIGDFSARSSKWWALDKDAPEGHEIESLTSTAGYSQLINQLTHITNTSASCVVLIFTTNSSFVKDSGVELSLFDKCHDDIIFRKVSLKISIPPPYTREVWNYGKANVYKEDTRRRYTKKYFWC